MLSYFSMKTSICIPSSVRPRFKLVAKDERKISVLCLSCIKAVICTTLSKALPSLSLFGPWPANRCTHGGSIAFWDHSHEHLYPTPVSYAHYLCHFTRISTGVFFELACILLLYNIVLSSRLMMLVHPLFFHTGSKHAAVTFNATTDFSFV